eukprot:gene5720-biopygen3579
MLDRFGQQPVQPIFPAEQAGAREVVDLLETGGPHLGKIAGQRALHPLERPALVYQRTARGDSRDTSVGERLQQCAERHGGFPQHIGEVRIRSLGGGGVLRSRGGGDHDFFYLEKAITEP